MKTRMSRLMAMLCTVLVALPMLGIATPDANAQEGESYFVLYGEPTEYVTQGDDIFYAESADIQFSTSINYDNGVSITIDVTDNGTFAERWQADFAAPGNELLQAGDSFVATRFPFQESDTAGVSVSGAGRGCNAIVGEFAIRELTYTPSPANEIDTFAADFRQSCDGGRSVVGGIRINSTLDNPDPNFSISPTPTGETNFVLYGAPGEFVTQGSDITFTQNADVNFVGTTNFDNGITVNVDVTENGVFVSRWTANFAAPNEVPLVAGDEFGGATRFPFQLADTAGLSVQGDGRGCNTLEGEFRVYELSIDSVGRVDKFAADFRQACGTDGIPVVGGVRINSDAPITDPDFSLDTPPTGDSDSRFVLFGGAGDSITQGNDVIFDASADVAFSTAFNDRSGVSVTVDLSNNGTPTDSWHVEFAPPNYEPLMPGDSFLATRFPLNEIGTAGLSVTSEGRTCDQIHGEFTIREIVYTPSPENGLDSFAADFRQSCDDGRSIVGGIRYNSTLDDPDPDFSISPAPTGATSFVLYGSPDNFLTQGSDISLTPSGDVNFVARVGLNNVVALTQRTNEVTARIDLTQNGQLVEGQEWFVSFAAPNDVQLAAGDEFTEAISHFYIPGDILPDTASPGFNIRGIDGRGCSSFDAEFRVYELTVNSIGQVEKLAADFRQLCGSDEVPLVGGIRINSDVPVTDPGFMIEPPTPVDDTPPVAEAGLIQTGRIKGTASNFDVVASCTDENPGAELTSIEINGEAVEPGERVRLIINSRERVRRNSKGKLIIRSASITLTVSCVDAAGNTSTATVQPSYEG